MSTFTADPHWGWWIVGYFFLGGIAAGAYFTAALIDLRAVEADRRLARIGYALAFPLIIVCGVFLVLDLDRPERFWHMLVKSEIVHEAIERGWPWAGDGWSWMVRAPSLKPWSPMSIGSWALALFGLCSALSLLGSLWPGGRLERRLRRGFFGRMLQIVGSVVGFFIASYTGALLTATNQPLWSDTTWIAPLFLVSAAATGVAMLLLLGLWRRVERQTLERLDHVKLFTLVIELLVFLLFIASLKDTWLSPQAYDRIYPIILLLPAMLLGMIFPILLHLERRRSWPKVTAAVLSLAGGLLLRYGILRAAPEIHSGPATEMQGEPWQYPTISISPEDGRRPGEGQGADLGNRPAELRPRSRVLDQP